MKAMILAAGRGERMRPLTDTIPKPLLPIKGKPLIEYHLQALANNNIKEIVINVSHLAQQIYTALGDGSRYGVRIHYSFEPELLETGGGIFQALPLLGNAPFIVISADLWTAYPLQQLPRHIDSLAHLIMVDNPDFHPTGDFHLNLNNGKLYLDGEPKLTYASMGVLHPDLFKFCKPGKFRLTNLLLPAIQQGQISGEHYQGQWENIGTVEQLEKINKT